MKARTAQIILLICLCMTISCIRRPKGILSDKDMAGVVSDLKLAEAYLQTQHSISDREAKEQFLEQVISRHGLTREEFDSTMSWYGRNVDAYYDMCEIADRQLAIKKKKMEGGNSVEIETSDLWPYQRQAYLSLLSGYDSFIFSLPTSDVKQGERVNLKFRINNPVSGNAIFGVEYEDGEKRFISRSISQSKRMDLTLQTDTARVVNRIFGHLEIPRQSSMPLWLDSIYLRALPFDSTEYYNITNQRHYREPRQRRLIVSSNDSLNQVGKLSKAYKTVER